MPSCVHRYLTSLIIDPLASSCAVSVVTEKMMELVSMNTMAETSSIQPRKTDSSVRSLLCATAFSTMKSAAQASSTMMTASTSACTAPPSGLMSRYSLIMSRFSRPPYAMTVFTAMSALAATERPTHVSATSPLRRAVPGLRRAIAEKSQPAAPPRNVSSTNEFRGVTKYTS